MLGLPGGKSYSFIVFVIDPRDQFGGGHDRGVLGPDPRALDQVVWTTGLFFDEKCTPQPLGSLSSSPARWRRSLVPLLTKRWPSAEPTEHGALWRTPPPVTS
jgi:hypothetical protein